MSRESRQPGPAPLLVLLTCFAAGAGTASRAGNLLANAGFRDLRADGAPADWEAASDPGCVTARLATDDGPGGRRAVRLECRRVEEASGSGHGMLAQRAKVRLEPGRWYRLSLWARESGIPGGGVTIAIYRMRGFTNCGLNVTARLERRWRRLSFVFQAQLDPGPTGRFQIWYGESGTLWVSEPELVECEAPERQYHPSLPPAPGKNLVPNAGFEAGAGGWGGTADLTGWGSRGLNFRFGELDESVAFDGKCSYRIAIDPTNAPVFHFDYYEPRRQRVTAPLLANEGWIFVKPGESYTLSAMMKADRPGVVARMGLRDVAGAKSESARLSTEWRRHSVAVVPGGPRVFVALGPDLVASKTDTATVWIDCVQLEVGANATPFAPYGPVDVGFETGRPGNLFDGTQPITVTATASNPTAAGQTVAVAWRAADFFDQPAGEGQASLTLQAGARARQVIDTGIARPGFYRLFLTARTGGHTIAREMRVASVVPVPSGDSHVGMNHAYGWPQLLGLCDRAGVRWVRDWSVKWQHVQPRPGPFDFGAVDPQFRRVLDRGLPVLALLPFSANDWAAEVPADFDAARRGTVEAGKASLAPKDPAQFGALLAAAIARYGRQVRHWEILNEPLYTSYTLPSGLGYKPADYVRILEAAYAAAKKADPGCTIVGGVGGHPLLYTRQLIAAGALGHLDALNLHLYPAGAAPEVYEPQLAQLRRMLRAAGRPDLPVWVTECGLYAEDRESVTPAFHWNPLLESERQCSEYLVRFNAIALGHGAEKLFFHYGAAGTVNNEDPEGIFFAYGGAPRKMLAAQAVFCRLVPGGCRVLKVAELHPQARTYLFGDADHKVMIAWVPDLGDNLQLRLSDSRLSATDIMGGPIGARSIPLTEAPVYIAGPATLSVEQFLGSIRVEKRL